MSNVYDDPSFFQQYARMIRSQQGLAGAGEWHQFRALFPDLSGKYVLDLGCGYGWHCRYAAEQGAAHVLGLDMSQRMIDQARVRNPHPNIQYQVLPLEDYDYPPASFDCVISNLALHYVADIASVFRRVFATLRGGGTFC